jgi:hypothetical protein
MKRLLLIVLLAGAVAQAQVTNPPGVSGGGVNTGGAPSGTAVVANGAGGVTAASGEVNANGAGPGALLLKGSTSGEIQISVAAIAGTPSTLLLPTVDPTEGQLLVAHAPASCSGYATTKCVQLYWATVSGGVVAPNQETTCANYAAASSTTVNCTVTGLLGGETIVAHTIRHNGVKLTSVVDSAGTMTQLSTGSYVGADSNTLGWDRYFEYNASAGSHTITLTVASPVTYNFIFVDVIRDVPTSSTIDASSVGGSGSSMEGTCDGTANETFGPPAITTTAAPEFVLLVGYGDYSGIASAGGGVSLFAGSGNQAGGLQVSAGPISPTFIGRSSSSPRACVVSAIAFKHK